jgi:hypothetical protein
MISMTQGAAGPGIASTIPGPVQDQGGLLLAGPAVQAPAVQPGVGRAVLTPAEVAVVLSTGARAPSVHNTQPWKFRVSGDLIELQADPDRLLRHVDPAGRELMISCGAALFGLRLGLRKLGYLPIAQLLPDAARPWLAGRVRPAGRAPMTKTEVELAAAVPHRHTHRGPFSPGEIAPRLLASMAVDAAAEGAELALIGQTAVIRRLAALTGRAAAEQRANTELMAELARWVLPAGADAREGVPAWARTRMPSGDGAGLGPGAVGVPRPARLPQRDFGLPGSEPCDGEPPSVTAVLTTAGDTPADWLRAGQALHRLLLRAASRWVFASLQTQPLESPRYREEVRELLALSGQPQMLLEFGRANSAAATPRRPQAGLRTNAAQA